MRGAGTVRTKPLWACPRCGQTFVTANVWHSCVNIPVDVHFAGKPASLRVAFERFVAQAKKNGTVTLRPVKTRIALQANTRFAAVTVRRNDLSCHVVLGHGTARPPVRKIDKIGGSYVHAFVIKAPSDVDARVAALLKEAYALDRKRHGALSA